MNDTRALKEQFEAVGEYRVDVVSSTTTYRGWAQYGSSSSSSRWMIERETLQGTLSVFERVGVGFDKIWDSRTGYFGQPPWANSYSTQFDGVNDSISFGDNLNKERTAAFSFSCWIRPRIVTTNQTIYSKRDPSTGRGIQIQMLANGRLDFSITNTSTTNQLRVQMGSSILGDTWQHVVFTYDGSSTPAGCVLYINGNAIAMSTIVNNLSATALTSVAATIGAFNSGTYWDGYIDEVSFWTAVLTSAQVLEIYNGGSPKDLSTVTVYSSLEHWWRMGDSDTFPTIADSASTGKVSGTMTNMLATSFSRSVP